MTQIKKQVMPALNTSNKVKDPDLQDIGERNYTATILRYGNLAITFSQLETDAKLIVPAINEVRVIANPTLPTASTIPICTEEGKKITTDSDPQQIILGEISDIPTLSSVQIKGKIYKVAGGGGSYVLPIASDTRLGGVKVGTGLEIDSITGVLSAKGGGGGDYTAGDGIYFTGENSSIINADAGRKGLAEGAEIFNDYSYNMATAYMAHAEGESTRATAEAAHSEGYSTVASNENAHAEGRETYATGICSHSEGSGTYASESYSHSEGHKSSAVGVSTHAEGEETTASGHYSHSEGIKTSAEGESSHAEGRFTIAHGENSHSEGYYSTAYASGSHAEGYQTRAAGSASHSEGSDTRAYGQDAHSEGSGTYAYGYSSHSEGAGSRAYSTQSHAEGSGTQTYGQAAHVEGAGCINVVTNGHVEGSGNVNAVSAFSSHTEGAGNVNYGHQAHVEGSGNTLSGEEAHIEGAGNQAHGPKNHVEGGGNRLYGTGAHIEGKHNTAEGFAVHAEGMNNTIGVESPTVFSYGTTYSVGSVVVANAVYTTTAYPEENSAFLYRCVTAPGQIQVRSGVQIVSPTEWDGTLEYQPGAVVYRKLYYNCFLYFRCTSATDEGDDPLVSNKWTGITVYLSPFTGRDTSGYYLLSDNQYSPSPIAIVASGVTIAPMWEKVSTPIGAHIEGFHNIVTGDYQHVGGKYNVADANKAFIIGNGTASNARSNALTVDWSGNTTIAGDLTTGTHLSTTAQAVGGAINELKEAIPSVTVTQIQSTGTKIATIKVNSSSTDLYAPTSGGASSLSGLSDVTISSAASGQALVYDSNNSEWKNGSISYSNISGTPTLAAVATSGSYSDLTGTPTLATVATSGSYSDLSNQPTIPDDLSDMSDVVITTPSNNDVLKYDSATSKWVNGQGGGGASTLSGLTDVTITSATSGQVLTYNGTNWVNSASTLPWTDITGTLTAGSTSITLSDASITSSATIEVFTDADVDYNSISVTTGSVTITFDAQVSNMGVKVRVS